MPKKKSETSSTIGKRLKELRSQVLGLTQKELSDALKTTQAGLSIIENDGAIPSADFMQRIADRYPDVNFNWLFYNEGKPTKSDDVKNAFAQAKLEAEKALEKKWDKKFQNLNAEMERIRSDNSKLIDLAIKKK